MGSEIQRSCSLEQLMRVQQHPQFAIRGWIGRILRQTAMERINSGLNRGQYFAGPDGTQRWQVGQRLWWSVHLTGTSGEP